MIQLISIILLSIIVILLMFITLFYYKKYKKLKKGIEEYEDIGTGRRGFYKYSTSVSSYYSIVYVKELDRYTDGYSKIKLERVEAYNKYNQDGALEIVQSSFMSLKKTSEIEWLESEDHIKKVRKEKLENIKKI